ncbi:MAG TPA: hypothetical protein VNL94_03825, partial [Candidatus Binatia bacterium]|nr:hypothetical protein [Candidatus Binatia bacterium]
MTGSIEGARGVQDTRGARGAGAAGGGPGSISALRAVVRGIAIALLFFALLIAVWEGAKALGGDPWR